MKHLTTVEARHTPLQIGCTKVVRWVDKMGLPTKDSQRALKMDTCTAASV